MRVIHCNVALGDQFSDVLVVGRTAFKLTRHSDGARCNLFEADLYRRTTPQRKAMLCPVISCAPNGALLIMRSAVPLSTGEADKLKRDDGFLDWNYEPRDGESAPFEYKASDWGWLDGKLVAVDYGAPALHHLQIGRWLIR
jgi:hypothetical protein